MEAFTRPVEPYIVPLDQDERRIYHELRIASSAPAQVHGP
jgi:hypothetical protein